MEISELDFKVAILKSYEEGFDAAFHHEPSKPEDYFIETFKDIDNPNIYEITQEYYNKGMLDFINHFGKVSVKENGYYKITESDFLIIQFVKKHL